MFGAKYCSICGIKVGKGNDFERFGKRFCSEEHAQQYTQEMEKARQATLATVNEPRQRESSGCC